MDQNKNSPVTTNSQFDTDLARASLEVVSGNKSKNTNVSKIPFGNYLHSKYRKQAALFIIIPFLVLALNAIPNVLVWLITALLSPLLFISVLYGIFLLFKRDTPKTDIPTLENSIKRLSYRAPTVVLIIGLIMWAVVGYIVIRLELSGNSGSMAGIAALPFMFCGVIPVPLSIAMYLLRYAHNKSIPNS